MKITSSAFLDGQTIPKKYTCDGNNINPALAISNVPKSAKSLVLIMDDPDAPSGNFTHWLLWNILPSTQSIQENSVPINSEQGINSADENSYMGPCPHMGTHRYFFKLFALDSFLNLPKDVSEKDIENAMLGHVIEKDEMFGLYSREAR